MNGERALFCQVCRVERVASAPTTEYRLQTDRQTDGRTDGPTNLYHSALALLRLTRVTPVNISKLSGEDLRQQPNKTGHQQHFPSLNLNCLFLSGISRLQIRHSDRRQNKN